jgi:hypothetical protein
MMYVKHLSGDAGNEIVIEAEQVRYLSDDPGTPVAQVEVTTPKGEKYLFEYGDVFVMGEAGKTIQRYYLGDMSAWERRRAALPPNSSGNVPEAPACDPLRPLVVDEASLLAN